MATGGCGGHVFFFAKYTLNLPNSYPIFSSQKILFSYIIFVKSGLTPCYLLLLKRSVDNFIANRKFTSYYNFCSP